TWLAADRVVILDRYVYSNIAYQCAKLEGSDADRAALRTWINELEYNHNHIPHPDLSLFLDVPFSFTERKLTEQREGDDRDYLKGGKDIYESSLTLQQRVRATYLDAARTDARLRVVDCSDHEGGMASPETIFARICEVLQPILK
ncbi:MAG: thymidylate kinase, partial [Alistipes sp.]